MKGDLRILIVEDSLVDALVITRALQRLNRPLNVRHAVNEEECRAALCEFAPEVVLSDLLMPGFSGLDVLALVRAMGLAVPFIFVSGTIDGESAVQFLKQGATDYVLKSHLHRLVPSIERALREAKVTQEHRRAEENYRGIFENAVLGIYQLTPTGDYAAINPALAHLLGHDGPIEMLAATTRFSECFVDPKRAEEFFSILGEKGEVHNFEAEISRRDGSRLWVACHARIVPPTHGIGTLCEGFVEDRTRQREMEIQIQRAKRLESIGTLANGVAHDLNNILAPILMGASMLRSAVTKPEHTRMLALIEESAQHGTQIVRQVMALRSGGEEEWRALQVSYLLKDLLKVVADTFPKAIALESSLERGLDAVKGNAAELRLAILALCTNARDAMPEGGKLHVAVRNVELSAEALAAMSQSTPPGRYVLIEVRDTGTGIAPGIRDRIFDPFFTTKGIGKGTGLGLSEVCGIVKKHGGFVEVSSAPSEGATFQMYLPAAGQPTAERPALTAVPKAVAGRGQTVLVVDDEDTIRQATRAILDGQNYRVLAAGSGVEALGLYTKHRCEIALVVTDLMMPGMDGVALTRALRRLDPALPVILSSGRADKTREEELQSLGIQAHLDKPYTMGVLLDTVEQTLQPRASSV